MTFDPPDRFNMVEYFLDRNLEAGRADRVALIARDRRGAVSERTFGEVSADVDRAGHALREHGLDLEDRVLFALGDGPEFVAAWFGAIKIGAVATSVNPLLPATDYAYYLDYTRARVAVCDEDSLEPMLSVLDGARYLRTLLVAGPTGDRTSVGRVAIRSLDDAMKAAPGTLDPADTGKDDPSVWLFTSGTTGKPKGAVHFHHDFVYNAERYGREVMALTPDDRTMSVPKLFFGYATGSNLMFPFAAGAAAVVFHERPKPDVVLELVTTFRPTVLINVPTTINGMLAALDADRHDLSSLRYMTSAGEALPAELYQRWLDAVGCEILDGIGSAEMFHVFISNRLGDVRVGSLGKLVTGYSARIVDPAGVDVPEGEVGRLVIRGGSAALCYHGAREKSRETFHGDEVVTADLFRRDEDGYFFFSGRGDDMLKVGGIWVSPLEIEECLLKHEAVRECAVIGVTEDELVKPKAFVVVNEGHDGDDALAEALKEHARQHLARYKFPRFVEFLAELPRNDRGKVEKKKLRDREQAR